jgi:hypothetical protein
MHKTRKGAPEKEEGGAGNKREGKTTYHGNELEVGESVGGPGRPGVVPKSDRRETVSFVCFASKEEEAKGRTKSCPWPWPRRQPCWILR